MSELSELLVKRENLENLIGKMDGNVRLYSTEVIAKWQSELDLVLREIKRFSISKDTAEITKGEEFEIGEVA
jgi:predicted component of type VI protein secretion system